MLYINELLELLPKPPREGLTKQDDDYHPVLEYKDRWYADTESKRSSYIATERYALTASATSSRRVSGNAHF